MKLRQILFSPIIGLLIFFSSNFLQAQPFQNASDALEDMQRQMVEMESMTEKAVKLLPEIRLAVEDADFRAQQPLFRKMHIFLDEIETQIYAVSTSASQVVLLDPRLDVSTIQESCLYLAVNEDVAALALMDVVGAFHEGDAAKVDESLEEVETALRGLRFLLDNAALDLRNLEREF